MNPKAWGGALGAMVVGALVWGALAAFTNREFGIVAWLIGAGVGLAARALGSEGQQAGIACALLALVSILGGKCLTATFATEGQVREQFAEDLTPANYAEIMADAEAYPVAGSETEVSQFMIDHGYTEAATPDEVAPAERGDFIADWGDRLQRYKSSKPTLQQWQDETVELASEAFLAEYTFFDRIKDSMGVLDIVFILLGVASAYKGASGHQH